ncbi:helix-turn-helix transcriptional regulator [Caldalkalibacillus thermarum TA2.A1]|uniref:Helix-turn-helix transcriptional regulator n=1 Tax=Caldalkalibacillus thermarum (strain TA2.A1) TaxID=986075 RepID=A0A8X8LD28_CALTT|nr:helix-turn-helix transcriptional regulator [Caldalkalibacillus thermarum]QZT35470.1 helix-turn-helix transcriptional regulator [Caldalkalibacillus thermarum TA2.A1]
MELTDRQEKIIQIVKDEGPITGESIAEKLNVTRATLRPDLAILTMAGILDARPRVGYFYTGKTTIQAIGASIKNKKVKDYKSIPVLVKENTSVYDAICTMFLEDVGTLFVVNENNDLAGVVSRKDLLRTAIGKHNLEDIPVSIIMTRMPNIILTYPDESLHEAASKLIRYQIDALPVVKPKQKADNNQKENKYEVVGRITKTTITRAYVDLGNEEL